MAIALELLQYDKLYHSLKTEKFSINGVDYFNADGAKLINSSLMRNYTGDNISVVPQCNCGDTKGAYYLGMTCSNCLTTVKNNAEDNVSFVLWCKQPIGVNKFFNPFILGIMLDRYKISKPTLSFIQYMMNAGFKIDKKQQKTNLGTLDRLITIFESYGIQRGYNSFTENLIPIVEILEKEVIKAKKADPEFIDFLYNNKDDLFSEYLPFPNSVLLSTEQTELGKFMDKSVIPCIDTVRSLTGIDLQYRKPIVKQNKVANALITLSRFYKSYFKDTVFSKPGLIRQHISSTRNNFTARAVVTSIQGRHRYNDFVLPWAVGVQLFREMLLNKLDKRGWLYKDASELLRRYTRVYNPLLDEIFKEIISETLNGIDLLVCRNPSLHRGSILHLKCPRVKTDANDNTVEIADEVLKLLNCDYDGDALQIFLPTSELLTLACQNFDPHLNLLGLNKVNGFSNAINLPKTIISLLSNWYEGGN